MQPRDSTSFEVREALGQDGCPVCRLAVRSVGRWLASVAYDQINDIELRNTLRAARGFCNVHAHRWLREVRGVLGTAILYQDFLGAALPTDGCSRAENLALPEPHVLANLFLGLAACFLQGVLQLRLVRRFAGLTQSRQNGIIAVDFLNQRLAVVRLFDA